MLFPAQSPLDVYSDHIGEKTGQATIEVEEAGERRRSVHLRMKMPFHLYLCP